MGARREIGKLTVWSIQRAEQGVDVECDRVGYRAGGGPLAARAAEYSGKVSRQVSEVFQARDERRGWQPWHTEAIRNST